MLQARTRCLTPKYKSRTHVGVTRTALYTMASFGKTHLLKATRCTANSARCTRGTTLARTDPARCCPCSSRSWFPRRSCTLGPSCVGREARSRSPCSCASTSPSPHPSLCTTSAGSSSAEARRRPSCGAGAPTPSWFRPLASDGSGGSQSAASTSNASARACVVLLALHQDHSAACVFLLELHQDPPAADARPS